MQNLSEEEKKAIEYYNNKEYSFSFETNLDFEQFKKAFGIEETEEDSFENHEIRFKTLLNIIEKQSKEIEHLKNLNEHQSKDMTKAVNYTFELNKEIEIKDKIIDSMSEEIFIKRAYAITCEEDIQKLKERIKEEYRKKV